MAGRPKRRAAEAAAAAAAGQPQELKQDYRAKITQQFIEALQNGTAPWQKPWVPGVNRAPYNATTDKPYRGGNTVALMLQNRDDPRWMTRKQGEDRGYILRPDEYKKSVGLEYWDFTKRYAAVEGPAARPDVTPSVGNDGAPSGGDGNEKKAEERGRLLPPRVRYFSVYNVDQFDGVPKLERGPEFKWDPYKVGEIIKESTGLNFIHGEHEAFVRLDQPKNVYLPRMERFPSPTDYYDTALHEIGHAFRHPDRLAETNRPARGEFGAFGSPAYAREELRAELAAFFIATDAEMPRNFDRNAAYVNNWISVLQKDKNELFRASSDAQAVADVVMGLARERILEYKSEVEIEVETRELDGIQEWSVASFPEVTDQRHRATITRGLFLHPTELLSEQRVIKTLDKLPEEVIRLLDETEMRIRPLITGERYRDASPNLRRLEIDVDVWGKPPAGLFVVEEKTLYLKDTSETTTAHEIGHAVDLGIGILRGGGPVDGHGIYMSGADVEWRSMFAQARSFLTPYMAAGLDESWAEAFRGAHNLGNEQTSPWPDATRERMAQTNPDMLAFIDRELEQLRARYHVNELVVESIEGLRALLDITALPVIDVQSLGEYVDRESFAKLGMRQELNVIGRSEDASRVFGRAGIGAVSVDARTFDVVPMVGDRVVLTSVDGKDTVVPVDAREVAL